MPQLALKGRENKPPVKVTRVDVQRKPHEDFFYWMMDKRESYSGSAVDRKTHETLCNINFEKLLEHCKFDYRAANTILIAAVTPELRKKDFEELVRRVPSDLTGDVMRARFGINDAIVKLPSITSTEISVSQALANMSAMKGSAKQEAFIELMMQVGEEFRMIETKSKNGAVKYENLHGISYYEKAVSPETLIVEKTGNCISLNLALGLMADSMAREAGVQGVELSLRRVLSVENKEVRHAMLEMKAGGESLFFDATNAASGLFQPHLEETGISNLSNKRGLYRLGIGSASLDAMNRFNNIQQQAHLGEMNVADVEFVRTHAESFLPVIASFSSEEVLRALFPTARELNRIQDPNARFECALVYASTFKDATAAEIISSSIQEMREKKQFRASVSPYAEEIAGYIDLLLSQPKGADNALSSGTVAHLERITLTIGSAVPRLSGESHNTPTLAKAYYKAVSELQASGYFERQTNLALANYFGSAGYAFAKNLGRSNPLALQIERQTNSLLDGKILVRTESSPAWFKTEVLSAVAFMEQHGVEAVAANYNDWMKRLRFEASPEKHGDLKIQQWLQESTWYENVLPTRYSEPLRDALASRAQQGN